MDHQEGGEEDNERTIVEELAAEPTKKHADGRQTSCRGKSLAEGRPDVPNPELGTLATHKGHAGRKTLSVVCFHRTNRTLVATS